MDLHEFQAKALLRGYGVPVPRGIVAASVEAARKAAAELGTPVVAVKAQIHAGGRGKGRFKEPEAGSGGGVRLARSPSEAATATDQMLGRTLVTAQTGAIGRKIRR
ncbi:MAG: acetate--CoA ligase family protein, partial [Bauldia sp.]|nr:acetate--CoA ligase family protein [Bauldia sp.]